MSYFLCEYIYFFETYNNYLIQVAAEFDVFALILLYDQKPDNKIKPSK